MIAQIFGMAFVGIIMICIGWTIVDYILLRTDRPRKRNKKLLDNMNRMSKK